ncbi:MAG TPA: hypothetical protein VKT52_10300, partial [Ktedonobacterales bacterium]|nr:hypothetical protein [Ktedonobacterales bacterium]
IVQRFRLPVALPQQVTNSRRILGHDHRHNRQSGPFPTPHSSVDGQQNDAHVLWRQKAHYLSQGARRTGQRGARPDQQSSPRAI